MFFYRGAIFCSTTFRVGLGVTRYCDVVGVGVSLELSVAVYAEFDIFFFLAIFLILVVFLFPPPTGFLGLEFGVDTAFFNLGQNLDQRAYAAPIDGAPISCVMMV